MIFLWNLAMAADVHRCDVQIAGPLGAEQRVAGFGDDEAQARRSALQAARILAQSSLLRRGIQAWYPGGVEAQAPLGGVLDHKGSKDLAVPGWTLVTAGCEKAETEAGTSYTATWAVGSEEVRRSNPARAIEASRRRACLPLLQRNLMQIVDQVIKDETQVGQLASLDGTWNEFATCWTGEAPPAAPSTEPFPDTSGPARCAAIDGDGEPVSLGFGGSAEAAAEQALRQGVWLRMQRAVHQLAQVSLEKPAAEQKAAMAAPLRALVGLAGASDAVDRTRLACAAVTPGPIRWPVQGRRVKACNAASWTERPRTDVKAVDAPAFLDGTCTMQISPTFEIVRFAGRSADPPRKAEMITSAFNVTGDCATACYREAIWGTVGAPVRLHAAPDRSSKAAVIDSLKPLVDGKSLTGLELLPTLQDPGALGALLSGELSAKLKSEARALPGQAERWKQVEGNWILLP